MNQIGCYNILYFGEKKTRKERGGQACHWGNFEWKVVGVAHVMGSLALGLPNYNATGREREREH